MLQTNICERVCVCGQGRGAVGKSSAGVEEGDGKREKSKMGQKEQGRLPGRGVAGIRQGGICPKEESSWMSYWAEFEKDG